MCSTSKCAIQVNKVGLKPTYPNTCNIENFVTQLIFLGFCPKKKKKKSMFKMAGMILRRMEKKIKEERKERKIKEKMEVESQDIECLVERR